MAAEALSAEMFDLAWSEGIAAVSEERITALHHLLVMSSPSIDRYRTTEGQLKQEMDQVLDIGLARLQKSGEAAPE